MSTDIAERTDAGRATPPGSRQLFAALYDELHRLAERQVRSAAPGVAIGATTLLHEAYLDMASREGADFPDRARFFGYAARAMRGIVIDHVRRARARKRGGGAVEVTLGAEIASGTDADHLDGLSDALDELAAVEPALAELVDLHFFCGFSLCEIAELRGVSERTAQREWRKARMLLHRAMGGAAPGGG